MPQTHLGNSKSFTNNFVGVFTQTNAVFTVCHQCGKIWDGAGTSVASLLAHLETDHGYTDED